MFRDSERQAIFLRRLLPVADDVAVRAIIHRIPFMQRRIPQEEIVVMRPHAHEVSRAGLFVKFHQFFWIPLFSLPQWNYVLPAICGRMAPACEVVFVIRRALLIHLTGIPVAFHRHRLRTPVCPDAELGVAKPRRTRIIRQRIHCRLKWTRRYGQFRGVAGECAD
jgi:hypothetical protein